MRDRAVLAVYIATSARWSSSPGESVCSGSSAIPTLASTCKLMSSSAKGAASAAHLHEVRRVSRPEDDEPADQQPQTLLGAPAEQRQGPDCRSKQDEVAQGVGEASRHGELAAFGGSQDRSESQSRRYGGDAETSGQPVEPHAGPEPLHPSSQKQ